MALFTADFFPPVVDDPAAYGAIAAANSLSDIYAMGGEAVAVLNLAGFPSDWDESVTGPILAAAAAKVQEAGALWVGGHSVRAAEPLFGFAVFGEVAEEDLVTNQGAQPGDLLYLTKPLGCGPLTTAGKRGRAPAEALAAAQRGMAHLNRSAAAAMRAAGIRAATDVTGFGLLGHAANLARGSGVRLVFRAVALPLYEGAAELAAAGVFSGAAGRGRSALADLVEVAAGVPLWLAELCFDAETSGGLLVAVPPEREEDFRSGFGDDPAPVLVGEVAAGPAAVRLE
ncbi:MAG: selenide, water dikinase SelD [Planctomycetota bacterium]|nr:MAG: selenide, water dikinase SelD [Planctomycetota bacterium]